MVDLLSEIPPVGDTVNPGMRALFYAVSYVLCAVHTILEARRAFSPRGVAVDPGWNA